MLPGTTPSTTPSTTASAALAPWTAELRGRGITLLPGSGAVPVELYGLLPDGRALHFRCRGTSAALHLYAGTDVELAVGVREAVVTELPVTGEVRLPASGFVGGAPGRAVLTGTPVATAVLDGRARFGWTGHEAGLLRGAEALPLFSELLDELLDDRVGSAGLSLAG